MTRVARRTVLAAALALSAGATLPAFHLRLVKSAPEADQTLKAPPPRLQLWFSEVPAGGVSQIALKRDTADVAVGKTTVIADEKTIYADPVKALAPGSYTIAWKTAGTDGHALTGEIKFVVATPSSPLR